MDFGSLIVVVFAGLIAVAFIGGVLVGIVWIINRVLQAIRSRED